MKVTWSSKKNKAPNAVIDPSGLVATINNVTNPGMGYPGGGIRATDGRKKGKWYWEVTNTSGTRNAIGICNEIWNLNRPYAHYNGTPGEFSVGMWNWDYYYLAKIDTGNATYTSVPCGATSVIGIALDMDNGEVRFYVNGTLTYTYSDIKSQTDIIYPYFGAHVYSGVPVATANFTGPFNYTPPSGFSPYGDNTPWYEALGKVKNDLANMKIGDVISCEYIAESGKVGTFANFGRASKKEILFESSSVPNGRFYFIHTGFDSTGKAKLIADRVIQHSISWTTLNKNGFIYGRELQIDGLTLLPGQSQASIRAISGGVNLSDYENEWEQVLLELDINPRLIPGENNIWHWTTVESWTSSTPATSTYKVTRGGTSYNSRNEIPPGTVSTAYGFRPMLVVEIIPTFNNIFESSLSYIYDETVQFTGQINSLLNKASGYRILVGDRTVLDQWSARQPSPIDVSVSVTEHTFLVGENSVYLETIDELNNTNKILLTITKKLYQSTYISTDLPNDNFSNLSKLKSDLSNTTLIGFKQIDKTIGYAHLAELTLKVLSGSGDIKIAPILEEWEEQYVTFNSKPIIDKSKEKTINIAGVSTFSIGDLIISVEDLTFCGLAIYSETDVTFDILGNDLTYEYYPTRLHQPIAVYGDYVELSWEPILLPKLETFLECVLKRSITSDFATSTVIAEITNKDLLRYRDNTISKGTYYYRLEIHLIDNAYCGNQLDFDFIDRELFIEEDSINGTEFYNGIVRTKLSPATSIIFNLDGTGFTYDSSKVTFTGTEVTLKNTLV